ncbi:3365_t:CDS:2 [Dentiscutata heterogama]|uniref:3365_t:CDS:1 n=1 Tax=Dentiscutata heterogama TaxID=1316150 RepID=A0ACA9KDH0_9GLOM|nr:3365_t:CDS:2 [Dentiscutata heterogama]
MKSEAEFDKADLCFASNIETNIFEKILTSNRQLLLKESVNLMDSEAETDLTDSEKDLYLLVKEKIQVLTNESWLDKHDIIGEHLYPMSDNIQMTAPQYHYLISEIRDDIELLAASGVCTGGIDHHLVELMWLHSKQIDIWSHFYDVVFLDTTCRMNRFNIIMCVVVCVDNHNRSWLVAIALIIDEQKIAFEWVLQGILKATGCRHISYCTELESELQQQAHVKNIDKQYTKVVMSLNVVFKLFSNELNHNTSQSIFSEDLYNEMLIELIELIDGISDIKELWIVTRIDQQKCHFVVLLQNSTIHVGILAKHWFNDRAMQKHDYNNECFISEIEEQLVEQEGCALQLVNKYNYKTINNSLRPQTKEHKCQKHITAFNNSA